MKAAQFFRRICFVIVVILAAVVYHKDKDYDMAYLRDLSPSAGGEQNFHEWEKVDLSEIEETQGQLQASKTENSEIEIPPLPGEEETSDTSPVVVPAMPEETEQNEITKIATIGDDNPASSSAYEDFVGPRILDSFLPQKNSALATTQITSEGQINDKSDEFSENSDYLPHPTGFEIEYPQNTENDEIAIKQITTDNNNDEQIPPDNSEQGELTGKIAKIDDKKWDMAEANIEDFIKNNPDQAFVYYVGDNEPVRRLSDKTKDFLDNIPAGVLPLSSRSLKPQNSVDITHGNIANPFAGTENRAPEPGLTKEVELSISIKKPDNSRAENLKIAQEAFLAGQFESAATYYKKVLETDEKNTGALFGLAATYQKSGQYKESRDIYIKLLEIDQNNWPALNNFIILSSQESPEEALVQLKRMEKYNSEFSPIPQQIGLIYIKQGKLKEAAEYLTRAVILAPENLGYRYNLAVLLDRIGENELAYKMYLQLIDAESKGKKLPVDAKKIQDRMAIIASK